MTRVPVSKKHTSSNESTKLVDETSSSYTYIHIHAHTFLSISPVHRSKKKKKKRIKEHTQASMCMLEKKKKEKLLLKLLHASYTRVYTICACISTSLLLLIDCSSSHLRENCFYLVSILIDERREKKKKKESNWEEFPREFCALTWFVCRWNSRGNSSEAKGVLESRKLFVRGADDLYKFMIINEGKENRRHPNSP